MAEAQFAAFPVAERTINESSSRTTAAARDSSAAAALHLVINHLRASPALTHHGTVRVCVAGALVVACAPCTPLPFGEKDD